MSEERTYVTTYPVLAVINGKVIGYTNEAQAHAHYLKPNEVLVNGPDDIKVSANVPYQILAYGKQQLPNPVDMKVLELYEEAKESMLPALIWAFGQKAAIPSVYDAPELYKRTAPAPDRPPDLRPRKYTTKDGEERTVRFRSPRKAIQTREYTLTAIGMTPDKWPKLPPQAETIMHALVENEHMQPWKELDITALMAFLVDEGILTTKQDPMRIFLYYKSRLENAGLIKVR